MNFDSLMNYKLELEQAVAGEAYSMKRFKDLGRLFYNNGYITSFDLLAFKRSL